MEGGPGGARTEASAGMGGAGRLALAYPDPMARAWVEFPLMPGGGRSGS